MSAIVRALRSALPPDRIDVDGAAIGEDLCGFDLGRASARVTPVSTGEVAAVVQVARSAGVSVVPVGLRTAYWRPIHLDGAVAIDLRALDHIGPDAGPHEPIWCGAGATVRALFDTLEARGQALPCHPDAYGDTSIGAMIATGFTSGIGMGTTGLDGLVSGLKVVLGSGEVLTTGTGAVLGGPPFVRHGLPDATGLFCGSAGSLGVITEVAVRPWPQRALTCVHFSCPPDRGGVSMLAQIAGGLREPGLYETFRAISNAGLTGDREPFDANLVLRAPFEGDVPADALLDRIEAAASTAGVTIEVLPKGTWRRWWGEAGQHWGELGGTALASLDVNFPYAQTAVIAEAFEALLADASELPCVSRRWAFYGAPDHLNVGVHLALDRHDARGISATRALIEEHMARFSAHEVVPYRWGDLWRPHMAPRVDETYRDLMGALKRACDPDNVLHRGALFWPEG